MKKELTFNYFQEINKKRCEECFHQVNDWSESDWGNAIAGEVGELCNMIKKRRRGEKIDVKELAKELADVVTYAFLIASVLEIDLEKIVIQKFNEVSDKVLTTIKIEE